MYPLKKHIKYTLFLLLLSFSFYILASAEDSQGRSFRMAFKAKLTQDTILFPVPQSENPYTQPQNKSLYLKNPSNIKKNVTFDPVTKQYTIENKIGTLDYLHPATYSFEEYYKWSSEQAIRDYWQEKSKAKGAPVMSGPIPEFEVNGEFFERVFGGNVIDFRPQGSAELRFGVMSNYRKDPFITPKLRRNTSFDFNTKIQMGLTAKIGNKLEFLANYNTESIFDFENQFKLRYVGDEDQIIKLIEAGNVNFPLNSTLITGSQSLFGIKAQLQFGRAYFTGILSQQQSQRQNITLQGGVQKQKYSIKATDYEEDKHFFIAQYFRDHYESGLETLPVITSNVNIIRMEVWVTNIGPAVNENRNIVAFQDLGENKPYNNNISPALAQLYPSNDINNLLSQINKEAVRDINQASTYLTAQKGFIPGVDFEKIESARKLDSTEYTYNAKLGFLSLNNKLNPDQVLALAFQYTIVGSNQVYKVGEFSNEGIGAKSSLIVKLLKSSSINTEIPLWKLMMKNVYNLNTYNISRDDFSLNILYTGNNNSVPTGYFTEGNKEIKSIPLIRVFNMDKLNYMNNPPADGVFDFLDNAATHGGLIESRTGRVYMPMLEPFGSFLRNKINDPVLADKYCFDSLYTLTKSQTLQYPEKDKFLLDGEFRSGAGADVSLNAFNIPKGSVKVTAGGYQLRENADYIVDYTSGKVKIINQGILNSGTPINISMESNSLFNVYNQTLVGGHLDYKVNKDLLLGATLLHLNEKPITRKVSYGSDPISNTVWGVSLNYNTDSKWITRMVDRLPFISTKAPSKLRIDAEFAHFIPGHAKAIGQGGISYLDDFEGSKSSISLMGYNNWFLASTPQGQSVLFPESDPSSGLAYGFNRAKLAWYVIDYSTFYDKSSSTRPGNITKDELSRNSTRLIYENELFPTRDNAYNQLAILNTLNLAYFPEERGPYNFDVTAGSYSSGILSNGKLANPASRWGGIMRKIETPDFETSNIEYITFWLMDPFSEDADNKGGELYFNLGDVSEDVLRDGRKSFENGLPTSAEVKDVDVTIWGRVPNKQSVVNSFDTRPGSRQYQDVGYDGLSSTDEKDFFKQVFLDKILNLYGANSEAYLQATKDPSSDNFFPFAGGEKESSNEYTSITNRYKDFNGPEGNSPENMDNNSVNISQRNPNTEDINNDNTLSEQERYFQYKVLLRREHMNVGENFITDIYESGKNGSVTLENGKKGGVKWYQFKIPIQQPEKIVGSNPNLRSVRFIRMFLKNFEKPIICRFATLELERGEWKRYTKNILNPGTPLTPEQEKATFDISAVNIEENSRRANIPYVLPPSISREVNAASSNYQELNEQSLSLKVCNLQDGDARGAFKNVNFDIREYKNLRMFLHAEKSIDNQELKTGDLTAFIRLGSDFTNNYYEYEVPLVFTPWNTSAAHPDLIWPAENEMNIELQRLIDLKLERNRLMASSGSISTSLPYTIKDGNNSITIVGTPTLDNVKILFIGVRNPRKPISGQNTDDGMPKCGEVWFNELRLSNFNEKSGWAANVRMSANLADLGMITVSGMHSSSGFGSIEKSMNQRQKEAVTQIDVATNLELGKFFPEKSGIRIPMHYDYSHSVITPKFSPFDPDVRFSDQMKNLKGKEKDSIREASIDVVNRQNINFMNVRKDRMASESKPKPWDIENFDFSYAYSKINHHNFDIEYDQKKIYRGGIGYTYAAEQRNIHPFSKFIKSTYLGFIRDFNFYFLPKFFSVRTDMNREYEERKMRNKSGANLLIEPYYMKRWDWNRTYDLQFDLTRSLRFEYHANANAYITEPEGPFNRHAENYGKYRDTVWNSILHFGTLQNYMQTATLNYLIPINKLPYMEWISPNAIYTSQYRWEASPRTLQERFGNMIANSRQLRINSSFRFDELYKRLKLFKSEAFAYTPIDERSSNTPTESLSFKDYALGILFAIKQVNVDFSKTNGINLPGFTPSVGILGNNWALKAPGLGFIFGDQSDIRNHAAFNNWLSKDTLMNLPYMQNTIENITGNAILQPIPNLLIELKINRAYSKNYQVFYKANANGNYTSTSPQERGMFSISYLTIATAFSKDNEENINPTFQKMLDNRKIIAMRLASQNSNSQGNDLEGYPQGYGAIQQQVLLYSFLSAYTGKDAGKIKLNQFPQIPIPNWTVSYNVPQSGWMGNYVQSLRIRHAYESIYSVNGFQNDIGYKELNGYAAALDLSNNFIPEQRMDAVTISERFIPLIGFELSLKNSLIVNVQYEKSRSLSLSFVSNQLSEMQNKTFSIGSGYRFNKVPIRFRSIFSGEEKKYVSDINLKIDFSIRDNATLLRKIEEQNNQVSAGMTTYSIRSSVDYLMNKMLNLRLFYDHTFNTPRVKSQIPTSNLNAGISLTLFIGQ